VLIFLFIKHFGINFKSFPKIPKEINYLAVFVLGSMLISTVFSVNIFTSLLYLFKQVVFFIICYIIYSLTIKLNLQKTLLYAVLLSGTLLAASVLYEFFFNYSSFISLNESNVLMRSSGLYVNPNAVGLFFATVVPVCMYFILSSKGSFNQAYFFTIIAMLIFALLLGNSRASMLAIFSAIGFVTYKLNRKLFLRLLLAAAALVLIVLIIDPLRELLFFYIRIERLIENTRAHYWSIAIAIFKDFPILGSGPGTFEYFIYKFMPAMHGTFTENLLWFAKSGTAHNFYLFRLSELGIVGIINAIYFIYIIFHIPQSLLKNKSISRNSFYLLIVFQGAVLGLFIRSIFETTGFITHGWITRDMPFWIFFIVILSHFKESLVVKTNEVH
jgi:O-antigen ligase